MKIYHLRRTQFLPLTITEAWTFFSSPANLGKITPTDMNFRILYSSGGDETYAGKIIRYKIGALPLITLEWMTEITHVDVPFRFVDEQRFGPFAFWHHQHSYKEVPGGIEMTDDLHYAIPLGILGRLAHWLFVGARVNAIFDYRTEVLTKLFPVSPGRK